IRPKSGIVASLYQIGIIAKINIVPIYSHEHHGLYTSIYRPFDCSLDFYLCFGRSQRSNLFTIGHGRTSTYWDHN
ncbi:MAG: hypothetical protein ACKPKG_09905, partial [Dolichospermum sp.]